DIPFDKLVLSQSNVRRVKAGLSIEELAESIARRGLIQSLHVRAVVDAEGRETGLFEVPAGGRRYRALELLVKQKRLARTAPVPCVVSEAKGDILIDELSLAENIERAPLHPLDQFRAFQAMRDKGMTEEAIAAAFFVGVAVVKQRLRLVTVSPKLLDLYAEDAMTLEQLMAFTVSSDHARQEQVWEAVRQGWQKEPWNIRRALTETSIAVTDKRALFVGVEAYEAAGGTVLRDLFQTDGGGWLEDVALLDRLVAEKLKAAADDIAGEGWKWIEVAVGFPYGHTQGLRRLTGAAVDLTEDERATIAALEAERDRLEADHATADEYPEEVDERLGEIETALAALEDRPVRFDPVEVGRAGAFVGLDPQGRLTVERGYVRSEDEPMIDAETGEILEMEDTSEPSRQEPIPRPSTATFAGEPVAANETDEDDDGLKPLPDRLLAELTAHRTLALRDAVAGHPQVAMTLLLHKLVSDTFSSRAPTGCLEASVRQVWFPAQNEELKDCPSAKAVAERQEQWGDHLPADDEALWHWLDALDEASRMALLAHCVSYGVNALHEKPNPYGGSGVTEHGLRTRLAQADRLARAVGLDMVEAGWRPTVANYLGRVPKARILEAVREGAGERAVQLFDHLKKGDMAKEAERLLAETGWVPEPLRRVDLDDTVAEPMIEPNDGDDGDLPAFLGSADDDGATADDEELSAAAE
ncbi:ParB/RepB/Spo0J family partition protein, partial [Pinisolibacter sp.]|uniref:ParB/RepB/Spo0J family partition protein n=1 Tax=Pinisolibacter sp. TaxID=2172024 RepID=UPI002FDD6F6B